MQNNRIQSNNVFPLSEFLPRVKRYFNLGERMFQKYVSRGLVPPPERDGKSKFYNMKESNVWEHLQLIYYFKNRYNLSLDDIGVLVDKYRNQIVDLNIRVVAIDKRYNSLYRPSPCYVKIRDMFLEKIQGGTMSIKDMKISIKNEEVKIVAKEIERETS
jgi:DNA-binding transcriptional MerR regulator